MATETATERRDSHIRSVTITTVATLAGVAAGVVSDLIASGPTDQVGVAAVAAAALVTLGVLRLLGVEVTEFSMKDNLYVFFMTFAMWFITWGIFLSSQAS